MNCSHCGREVRATVHQRKKDPGYRVDYYTLWTGELEEVAMKNPRDESEIMEFYKLNEPRRVITCSDCEAKKDIRKELDRLFSSVPKNKSKGNN